jgi:hypothetical protein
MLVLFWKVMILIALKMSKAINRDEHVKILVDNIEAGQEHNFEIKKNVDPAGTAYDLLSIMHYAPTAFSKNMVSQQLLLKVVEEARLELLRNPLRLIFMN